MRDIKIKLKEFNRDLKGNVAMIVAMAIPVLVFVAGSAVDLSRYLAAQQTVQAALDSASLAAAVALSGDQDDVAGATARAREILAINVLNNPVLEQTNIVDTLRLEPQGETAEVRATADLDFPTIFAGVFGFDSLGTTLLSTAGYATNKVTEIAFVLDTTGSMDDRISDGKGGRIKRIDALEDAMLSSIDTLLPESGANDDVVRVALVPYSNAINLGEFQQAALGIGNTIDGGNDNEARDNDDEGTCITEREGVNQVADIAPTSGQSDTFFELDESVREDEEDGCPNIPIRPLTNNREDLRRDVKSFRPRGRTAGHMGINWGLNVLSGQWQSFWPIASRPVSYSDDSVRKVLVILTDGEFNRVYYDDYRRRGRRTQGRISLEVSKANCDLAKEEPRNIEIYAIAFGDVASATQLLRSCAEVPGSEGTDQNFFEATNAEALNDAFTNIVGKELAIRLTQ